MKRFFILPIIALTAVSCMFQTVEVDVIPSPVAVETFTGVFEFEESSDVVPSADDLKQIAEIFAEDMSEVLGFPLGVNDSYANRGDVLLRISSDLEAEEYELEVADDQILVTGGSVAGVFYGLQTVRQLVDDDNRIEALYIKDKPYFAYRGSLFDVARHFYTVDEVKQYIDILAMHKLNRLHLHLTDDQGWRIQINKYPLLTEVGSNRKETVVGKNAPDNNNFDGKPHGGYYTQDEIRDIVAYAQARCITIVPEIDLPGHMQAALAAYPDLGCTGGPYETRTKWGISDDVLCAGNPQVYTFLEDVISEVLELFPSEYIHIGGDECPKVRWEACPKCQAKIRQLGLKDEGKHLAEHFLQNHVMNHIEKFLNERGRKMIGWDEILEGSASQTSTVMIWRDQAHAVTATRRGNDIINSLRHFCYLDYCQTSEPEKEPLCVTHRYLSLRQVYRFDPCERLMLQDQQRVLGVQANLWTEYIGDFKQVQHMLLPRLAAFAETAWAYDRKGTYEDFAARARKILPDYYQANGLHYAPYFFEGVE
jgi:hexosaminidase